MFTVYPDMDALPHDIAELMKSAVASREKAYAPYSQFYVGAAVLMKGGEVVLGNNQENAAFPSGLCAERVAIYHAGANYPGGQVEAIAITAASRLKKVSEPIPPCGACRQAIAEYEYRQKSPISIYFMGDRSEVYQCASIEQLLPLIFTEESLRGN